MNTFGKGNVRSLCSHFNFHKYNGPNKRSSFHVVECCMVRLDQDPGSLPIFLLID